MFSSNNHSINFLLPITTVDEGSPGILPFLGSIENQGFHLSPFNDPDKFVKASKNLKNNIHCLSCQERLIPEIVEILRLIRQNNSQSWICVGGPSSEYYYDILLQNGADFIFIGEMDAIFGSFLRKLPRTKCNSNDLGLQFDLLSNLSFKSPMVLFSDSEAVFKIDLYKNRILKEGEHILPDQNILTENWVFPWHWFKKFGWKRININVQRGCPWSRCTFCTQKNSIWRAVSTDKVLSTVKEAVFHQVESIVFTDDCFIQKKAWVTKLLSEMAELDIPSDINIAAQTRAEPALINYIPLMKKAGFKMLSLGIETLLIDRSSFYNKYKNNNKSINYIPEIVKQIAIEGIIPELNIILTDPLSTTFTIANELKTLLDLCNYVHENTGISPIFSINLTTIPVTGSDLILNYPYLVRNKNGTKIPIEFELQKEINDFLIKVSESDEYSARYNATFQFLEFMLKKLDESPDRSHSTEINHIINQGYITANLIKTRYNSQFQFFSGLNSSNSNIPKPPNGISIETWLSTYKSGIDWKNVINNFNFNIS